MRMKQTKVYSAQHTGVHALQWHICRSWSIPGIEWYIHKQSQLVKVGLIWIHQHQSGLDCRSQLCLMLNNSPGTNEQQKLELTHEHPTCISVTYSLGCGSDVCPNFYDLPGNAVALPLICEPVTHILTHIPIIPYTVMIAIGPSQI